MKAIPDRPVCPGHAILVCDTSGCRCEAIHVVPPAPARCNPPFIEHCTQGICGCVPSPAVIPANPDPSDACSIVLTMIIAGIQKTLLACWVDG